MVWYAHLLKNFPQFLDIHTLKGFSIVNEAEVDVFLELSCFFYDPTDDGNLKYRSSAFLNAAWTSRVPSSRTVEAYFGKFWALFCWCMRWVQLCSNLNILWHYFCDWNENWPFPVLWPLLSFPICCCIECRIFTASSFRIWNNSAAFPHLQYLCL